MKKKKKKKNETRIKQAKSVKNSDGTDKEEL